MRGKLRKVSVRDLRANLSHELCKLPFVITRNGKEIAMCTQISGLRDLEKKSVHNSEKKRIAVQDSTFVPYPKRGKK